MWEVTTLSTPESPLTPRAKEERLAAEWGLELVLPVLVEGSSALSPRERGLFMGLKSENKVKDLSSSKSTMDLPSICRVRRKPCEQPPHYSSARWPRHELGES